MYFFESKDSNHKLKTYYGPFSNRLEARWWNWAYRNAPNERLGEFSKKEMEYCVTSPQSALGVDKCRFISHRLAKYQGMTFAALMKMGKLDGFRLLGDR